MRHLLVDGHVLVIDDDIVRPISIYLQHCSISLAWISRMSRRLEYDLLHCLEGEHLFHFLLRFTFFTLLRFSLLISLLLFLLLLLVFLLKYLLWLGCLS